VGSYVRADGRTDGQCCFNRRFAEMRASLKRSLAIRMQLAFVLQISLIKVVRRTEFCVPEHTVSVFRQVICKAVWIRTSSVSFLDGVRKIAKNGYVLRNVCLSVRPSAWNISAPTRRSFVKFDTWVFFPKICPENLSCFQVWQELLSLYIKN